MDTGQGGDLAIFICCTVLLISYNLFYFSVSSFTLPLLGKKFVVLYAVNRRSRRSWVEQLSKDPKEGINAVQTIRNQVLAVSILAATTAPMAAAIINVITDANKLQQVASFSRADPISSTPLFSPQLKLGIAFGLLLLAVMAYAQSVRLSVHVSYIIRVVASDPARNTKGLGHLSVTLMRRSSLYFAVGLRFFLAWGPYVLWLIGPTALLISTLLDIAAMSFFDVIPASLCEAEAADSEADSDGGEEDRKRSNGGAPAAAAALPPAPQYARQPDWAQQLPGAVATP